MPIAINSPARNLFLLGSSGAQLVTNFFKSIDQSASTDSNYLPEEIRYYETLSEEDRFVLSGSANDNNLIRYGWFEDRSTSGVASYSNKIQSTQSEDTYLRALELDSNNNLIAVGKTGNIPWISKYTIDGVIDWQSTTNSADVEYTGIASDSNGQYYACGTSTSGKAFVEKFDANGNPGWGKSALMLGRNVVLSKIDTNSRGHVVAVGYLEDDTNDKGYIIKIDTNTGEILWDRTIETDRNVRCSDIFIDDNDIIYITANLTYNVSGAPTGCLLKYTAEGNLLWQTESDCPDNDQIEFSRVQVDGETQSVVVFGFYRNNTTSKDFGLLSKYAKDGSLVWRRTIESSESSGAFFETPALDSTATYYYILFTDQSNSPGGGLPDRYTFAKLSSSGNGLGAFQYNDGTGETMDYVYSNLTDKLAKLADGSVRNDTSDLITYPFNANKILFDDLATQVSNKRRQMDSADSFEYSGSPAIRPPDFRSYELTEQLELDGRSDRLEDFNFTTGGKSELSVECWFQVDDITTPKPTSKGYIWDQTPDANGASLRLSTGQQITAFTYAGGSAVLAQKSEVVQTGVWYHTVATFGNNQTKLYVNGVLEDTTNGTVSTINDPGSYPFTIGASTDNTGTIGDAIFTTPGQYTFTVPAGVTDVSMVLVGGGGGGATSTNSQNGQAGGGGGGGALMWRNGYTVSPGDILYITVGEGGSGGTYGPLGNDDGTDGGDSYVRLNSHVGTIIARAGGGGKGIFNSNGGDARFPNAGIEYSSTYGGGGSVSGGGNGGEGGVGQPGFASGGGGGAGGYTGDGGRGQNGQLTNPDSIRTAGQGGGGGGGGASNNTGAAPTTAGGGGVGIFGQGANGGISTGSNTAATNSIQSGAGSGGTSTDPNTTPLEKGFGGGGTGGEDDASAKAADGGSGAVRLVWGAGRSFPTTDVGAETTGADTREYLDGRVGELRAYDRILTANEVLQAYNATKSKYINEAPDTSPKIGPGIVYDSNLLLNYDFGNRATYNRAHNLYDNSANYGSSNWNLQGPNGVTTNTTDVLSPVGDYTATKWQPTTTLTQYIYDGIGAMGTETHTMSVWVRAADGETTTFGMNLFSPTQQPSDFTATDKWQRFTWTFTPQNQSSAYPVIVRELDKALYIWGPQIEKASTAGNYVPTYATPVGAPTTVKNLTGTSIDGTINLAPYNSGGWFEFDGGPDSGTRIAFDSSTIDLSGSFSIDMWFRQGAQTSDYWMLLGASGYGAAGENGIGHYLFADTIRTWAQDSTGSNTTLNLWDSDGTVNFTAGVWYNLILTREFGTAWRWYLNGSLVNSNTNDFLSVDFTSANTYIGDHYNDTSWQYDGDIAEVRMYNRALTGTEASQNFNATRSKYGV